MSVLSSSLYIENSSKRHLERYYERSQARTSLLQLHLFPLCQSTMILLCHHHRSLKWSRLLCPSRRLLGPWLHLSLLIRPYLLHRDQLGGTSLPHPLPKLRLLPSPASIPRMKRSGNLNTDRFLVSPHSPIEWNMMYLKIFGICSLMQIISSRLLLRRPTLMVYLDHLRPIDDLSVVDEGEIHLLRLFRHHHPRPIRPWNDPRSPEIRCRVNSISMANSLISTRAIRGLASSKLSIEQMEIIMPMICPLSLLFRNEAITRWINSMMLPNELLDLPPIPSLLLLLLEGNERARSPGRSLSNNMCLKPRVLPRRLLTMLFPRFKYRRKSHSKNLLIIRSTRMPLRMIRWNSLSRHLLDEVIVLDDRMKLELVSLPCRALGTLSRLESLAIIPITSRPSLLAITPRGSKRPSPRALSFPRVTQGNRHLSPPLLDIDEVIREIPRLHHLPLSMDSRCTPTWDHRGRCIIDSDHLISPNTDLGIVSISQVVDLIGLQVIAECRAMIASCPTCLLVGSVDPV